MAQGQEQWLKIDNPILITNNKLAKERLAHKFNVKHFDITYLQVLTTVRDYIHKGHKLLTHPLSGSVKPKETPYKSIVISGAVGELDVNSLIIIEESIATYNKFAYRPIPDSALGDFMEIDCSLIESMSH